MTLLIVQFLNLVKNDEGLARLDADTCYGTNGEQGAPDVIVC